MNRRSPDKLSAEFCALLALALRERSDAQLRGRIREEPDVLLGLIYLHGALRQRIGGSVFRAPGGKFAGFGGDAHRRLVAREGSLADVALRHGEAAGWITGIEFESVVPRARGKYLPVGGHAAVTQFYPVFVDGIGEDKRSAFNGDGVVEPARDARVHGESEFDAVACFPFALDARKSTCGGASFRMAVDAEWVGRGPSRDG